MAKRLFLLGPTASGKSAVALELAARLGAEIFSLDSMQVYRGMDVGTAKPTAEEQARVRHHLIDLVEPSEDFSVARWRDAAAEAEELARARGVRPLYVGGTGLYLKALAAGLHSGPAIPLAVRARAEQELLGGGRDQLRKELEQVDPLLHGRLDPGDDKRLLRGIETFRATGRPLGAQQREWEEHKEIGAPAVALLWPREVLRTRVARRFDAMLEAGFLEEVQRIREGPGFGRAAGKALGYRQLLEHLDGECTLEEAREKAVTLTRTFIRRQMTWLRSFPDLQWLEVEYEAPAVLAARVAELLAAR